LIRKASKSELKVIKSSFDNQRFDGAMRSVIQQLAKEESSFAGLAKKITDVLYVPYCTISNPNCYFYTHVGIKKRFGYSRLSDAHLYNANKVTRDHKVAEIGDLIVKLDMI